MPTPSATRITRMGTAGGIGRPTGNFTLKVVTPSTADVYIIPSIEHARLPEN